MSTKDKISPAFEPFLAESGRHDKRNAIVVYRAPRSDEARERGPSDLRALQKRQAYIQEQVMAQRPVEEKLLSDYKEIGSRKLPGDLQIEVGPIGASTLPVANVEVTRQTLPMLAKQPNVVAIMPNQTIRLIEPKMINYADLARSEFNQAMTWGLEQLDIPKMWQTTQGENINVAVLDTGVHADHSALVGRVKEFVVIDPLGRRITASPAFDSGRHGTHVCGTIAGGKTSQGVSIGVAPKANLLVAGALVGDATLATLLEAISWAVEKGADIINMSLGFSYYEPLFAEVFDILETQFGILPVVAIGNENHGNTSSPGNAYNAFSVGAVEKITRGRVDVTSFSSGASLVFPGDADHALVTKPDVVAPGSQVYSCIPPENRPDGPYEYTYMDGTSMATPHAAGVAALLMAARPNALVSDIIQAMKETAKHPAGAAKRPDNRWGFGMIQPEEALNAL